MSFGKIAIKRSKKIYGLMLAVFAVQSCLSGSHVYARNPHSPAAPSRLQLPSEYGRISQRPGTGRTGPYVIHIQTAHRQEEAENNVRRILEHLHGESGADLILLEGAWSRLDTELFRIFPEDPALQRGILTALVREGELTGSEAFLAMNEAVAAYGIEKRDIYLANGRLLLKVISQSKTGASYIRKLQENWKQAAAQILSKDLARFLARYNAFRDRKISMGDWLRYLGKEHRRAAAPPGDDSAFQPALPLLMRYQRLEETKDPDRVKLEQEQQAFLTLLEQKQIATRWITQLGEAFTHEGAGGVNLRAALEHIDSRLSGGIKFEEYPELHRWLKQQVLTREISQGPFYDEIRELTEKVQAALTRTADEAALLKIKHRIDLFEKLFKLELSREEYRNHFRLPETAAPPWQLTHLMTPKLRALMRGLTSDRRDDTEAVKELYGSAIRFYEMALAREDFMVENTLRRMAEEDRMSAVLLTGGFHSEGLREAFERQGVGYVRITPVISNLEKPGREKYLRVAAGRNATAHSHWEAPLATQIFDGKTRLPGFFQVYRERAGHIRNLVGKTIRFERPDDFDFYAGRFRAAPVGRRLQRAATEKVARAELRSGFDVPARRGRNFEEAFEGRENYVLVSDHPERHGASLYALYRAAQLERDSRGRPFFNILAVRPEWIIREGGGAGKISRFLYWDVSKSSFTEWKPKEPVRAGRVHFIETGEREGLSALYVRQGVEIVNAYLPGESAAAVAASRQDGLELLGRRGFDVPGTVLLAAGADAAVIIEAVRDLARQYFAENDGAGHFFVSVRDEHNLRGNNAPFFRIERDDLAGLNGGHPLVSFARDSGMTRDLVLQTLQSNLTGKGGREILSLRLFVSYDPAAHEAEAESGYVQSIAQSGDSGPVMLKLPEPLRSLTHDAWVNGLQRYQMTDELLVRAGKTAQKALAALNRHSPGRHPLLLAGVDLEIEMREGKPVIWVAGIQPEAFALGSA